MANNGQTQCVQEVKSLVFDLCNKNLTVLNQLLLPSKVEYVDVTSVELGHTVIKSMMVRGAPSIAAVGCLSIIVDYHHHKGPQHPNAPVNEIIDWLETKSSYILTSRPTAVNLRNAIDSLLSQARSLSSTFENGAQLMDKLTDICFEALRAGETSNRRLGDFGADMLIAFNSEKIPITVLTHCNTGTLATVGYGTALGVIRSLHNKNALERAYCTETRPYNQGSRLTAWELVRENIPATLIADNMVAYLMSTSKIDAVIVGADCVASNGDTANKIGTFQLAVVAKHFGVPFYVAAPSQSIDLSIDDQTAIKIEQRPANELRRLGDVILAPDDVDVWNPCFDLTPASLISGIITEFGICTTSRLREFLTSATLNSDQGQNSQEFALY